MTIRIVVKQAFVNVTTLVAESTMLVSAVSSPFSSRRKSPEESGQSSSPVAHVARPVFFIEKRRIKFDYF